MKVFSIFTRNKQASIHSVLGIFLIILLWKMAALYLGSDIILPPPEKTAASLFGILSDASNYAAVFSTVLRGAAGFLLAVAAALVVGIAGGLFPVFRTVLNPLIIVLRSTPVISVILLALIWFSSTAVPVFVAFLMIFPIVCTNIIRGMIDIDPKLIEMAGVYEFDRISAIRWIYVPSVGSHLYSAIETAAGLTWKVVIAAEVLSMPVFAMGTAMQESRIYLETARVFAWTVLALIISSLFHLIILSLLSRAIPGAASQRHRKQKGIYGK